MMNQEEFDEFARSMREAGACFQPGEPSPRIIDAGEHMAMVVSAFCSMSRPQVERFATRYVGVLEDAAERWRDAMDAEMVE